MHISRSWTLLLHRMAVFGSLALAREPERVEVLLLEEKGAGISATYRVIEGPGKAVALDTRAMRDAGKAVSSRPRLLAIATKAFPREFKGFQ